MVFQYTERTMYHGFQSTHHCYGVNQLAYSHSASGPVRYFNPRTHMGAARTSVDMRLGLVIAIHAPMLGAITR